ncbi:Cassette chromosome recombinase B [Propionibacterium freudenreichii]|nr:Cassette chromosome recombinase B [Propionibacterium freudenreichii]SCC97442.1 Cassette chromosome recombinase B [Propionibacterium freudenreichii]
MTSEHADEAAIDSLVAPTPFAGAIAVSYLRVSTKEQAEKGGNAEGFSIPAQREANQRKADQLGATIVEEFVDAGESARKADRPELMRMIKYVATHKTNYCIVHKVDRLARNRADDVTIHLALKDAGVTLVSATENIDETPSGMLLHGIMSSIAEFYSRNLATEVVKGLSQKAAQGGTVTKAPIGYRNVGIRDDMGREIRTVEVDEERAGLVRWAFQVFASGDWTTSQLHQELVARGLTTSPTPRRPSKPIAKSTVHRMLTNPYYKGAIVYQGVTYRGAHDPIVPVEVWEQVQIVLGTHKSAADATQIHDHYLKGSVFCGQCGSRLIVCNAKSSQGTIYPYFVCSSRHAGRNNCTRQAMLIEDVEQLIERFYTRVQIPTATRQALSEMIHAKFDQMMSEGAAELAELATRRTELEGEQTKLLQAHYAGAIPLDLLKREQDRINASLETIEFRIQAHNGEYAEARANLDDSLVLMSNMADIYANADDANRRLCNQALFTAIYIDEDNDIRVGYRTPFDGLSSTDLQADALTWAEQARTQVEAHAEAVGTHKKGQVSTPTKGGPLVESSNLTHLGWMTRLELATTWTTTRGSTS